MSADRWLGSKSATSLSARNWAVRPDGASCETVRLVAHQRPPCCHPVARRWTARSAHCQCPGAVGPNGKERRSLTARAGDVLRQIRMSLPKHSRLMVPLRFLSGWVVSATRELRRVSYRAASASVLAELAVAGALSSADCSRKQLVMPIDVNGNGRLPALLVVSSKPMDVNTSGFGPGT